MNEQINEPAGPEESEVKYEFVQKLSLAGLLDQYAHLRKELYDRIEIDGDVGSVIAYLPYPRYASLTLKINSYQKLLKEYSHEEFLKRLANRETLPDLASIEKILEQIATRNIGTNPNSEDIAFLESLPSVEELSVDYSTSLLPGVLDGINVNDSEAYAEFLAKLEKASKGIHKGIYGQSDSSTEE